MRIFLFSVILLLTRATAFSQPDKSLIAYFNFDDCSVNDVVGSGNTASVTGNPDCECGVKESGLRFNGLNDEVIVIGTISTVFQNIDFSLSFYFKPLPQTGNQVIFSKREDCRSVAMV